MLRLIAEKLSSGIDPFPLCRAVAKKGGRGWAGGRRKGRPGRRKERTGRRKEEGEARQEGGGRRSRAGGRRKELMGRMEEEGEAGQEGAEADDWMSRHGDHGSVWTLSSGPSDLQLPVGGVSWQS